MGAGTSSSLANQHVLRSARAYAALVLLPAAGVVVVLRLGMRLTPAGAPALIEQMATLIPAEMAVLRPALLLAQLIAILAVSRVVGRSFTRLGQPRVVGEMIAGVLLGPSVFGLLMPHAYELLFPRGSVRFLNALSQVGLMLFMFLVGLEVDLRTIKRYGRSVVLVAHAGIAVPFFLGAATALFLYPRVGGTGVSFLAFALFVGVAMSVTAFPVLARILSEQVRLPSALSGLALSSAAVSDVTAWCILALVVSVGRDAATPLPLWATIGGLAALIVVMGTIGRRAVGWIAARLTRDGNTDRVNDDVLAAVVVIALLCALTTELLGVHALFGAFLAGVVMPSDHAIVHAIEIRLREVLSVLLLPIFFAFSGLRLKIGLISGGAMWGVCLLVILVAVAGKLGGTALAARASALSWRESLSLGVLMNTRGLMELVVLNIGLDAGIISPPLYAVLIVMALVTTLMTTPMLRLTAARASPELQHKAA